MVGDSVKHSTAVHKNRRKINLTGILKNNDKKRNKGVLVMSQSRTKATGVLCFLK